MATGSWTRLEGRLVLKGVQVDKIRAVPRNGAVSSDVNPNDKPEAVIADWMDLLPSLDKLYPSTKKKEEEGEGETYSRALGTTLVMDKDAGAGLRRQQDGFTRAFSLTLPGDGHSKEEEEDDDDEEGGYQEAMSWFMRVANFRRLIVTERGLIGLVGPTARPGDDVWTLNGSQYPHILPPAGADSRGDMAYSIVGEAYIHGLMDGEGMPDDVVKVNLV